jgi:hypothetical protein
MSWGTAYSGSNNLHFNFPPIMDDGRTYTTWVPGAAVNDQLRKGNNIDTNWEYRQFLMHNSTNIMDTNLQQCFNQSGYSNLYGQSVTNAPFLYSTVADKSQPYGYEDSDLKNIYLSRHDLQSRMIAPIVTQDQLIMRQMSSNMRPTATSVTSSSVHGK